MAQDDKYIENPVDGRPLTKPPTTIIGIILTVVLLVSIGFWLNNKKDLKKNGILTTAKITKWNSDAKSGKWLNYEFTMDNSKYYGSNKYFELSDSEAEGLVNKYFPIIFISNYPDNNELLIRNIDYLKYNLTQPDSLKIYETLFKN